MHNNIFITGIGTNVGKTVVAAIITQALQANYWKPIQAGYEQGTDTEWVQSVLSNNVSKIYPEAYKLQLAASPHIAAREEGVHISLDKIKNKLLDINNSPLPVNGEWQKQNPLIIEGAGGLLVPLNENEFVVDLIQKLHAKVILVSRNYLGSINHSLLTAKVCKQHNIDVVGWVFNDQYRAYENEIVHWSGYTKIAAIPFKETIDKNFIAQQAELMREKLTELL